MTFKKIEPGVWNPENPNDELVGTLLGSDEGVGRYESTVYHLEMDDGAQISVWGSTVLDSKMRFVKAGQKVKIVYTGKQKSKAGSDTKLFEVYVDDGKEENIKAPTVKPSRA